MKRDEVLQRAADCVLVDRNKNYGSPEESFGLIARFWQVYLEARPDSPLHGTDVAIMMDLMKTARLTANPSHEDSWIDKAGYAACGGEVATESEEVQLREARAAL